MENKRNEYYPKNREAWRSWLQKNHAHKQNIWLIMYRKNAGKPTVTYDEVVEEALCFGWIDSKPNKRDDESYFLFVSTRKPKSPWSAVNKKRIENLLQQNKIEAAKKDGSWILLDKIEALEMPAALKKAFAKSKTGLQNFEQFPPGVKKQIYQWIISAKTEQTLHKRVAETVTLAEKNIRVNQWKAK